MSTHLTGVPGGDTGVYVWNQWVFRHEVLQEGHLPYFTDRIFALSEPTNLSLHNYTAFQNLLALPLIGILGVVATFNVIYLLMTVLTAYATFLLARHVTGDVFRQKESRVGSEHRHQQVDDVERRHDPEGAD